MLINTTRTSDGSVVVDVRGEIDVSSAGRLRHVLNSAAALRPARIVVDIRHVTLIDSTGLGALIGGRHAARVHGVAYSVRHPSAFVASQLRKIGVYDILITGD